MLNFKTIKEENECKRVWEKFSPNEVLWDIWDYRMCFHTSNFNFNFILGLQGDTEVGLLPLVYDTVSQVYTYFGDTFPEQNRFLVNDKKLIPDFIKACPKGTTLYYIDNLEGQYFNFIPGEKRYFLDISKFDNNFEKYIDSFTKKHRKNIKYDLKKISEKGCKIHKNSIPDFDILVDFNKAKFGEESNYADPEEIKVVKRIIDTALKKNMLDLLSIELEGKIEAVGLGVYYNKCYYVISVGRDVNVKNLGKFLIAEEIKSAIDLGCSEIDFLSTESKWKELWNLDSEMMYEYHDDSISD